MLPTLLLQKQMELAKQLKQKYIIMTGSKFLICYIYQNW
jgi:hypothetical protein